MVLHPPKPKSKQLSVPTGKALIGNVMENSHLTGVSLTQEGTQIFQSMVEYYPPEFLGIREDYKENKII